MNALLVKRRSLLTIAFIEKVFKLNNGLAYGARLIANKLQIGQCIAVSRQAQLPFVVHVKSLKQFNVSVSVIDNVNQEFGLVI